MLHVVIPAAAILAVCASAALACDGQTGKVIFEDQFSDEQGGWDFNEKYGLRLKAPGAEQTVAAAEGGTFTAQINETFNATQADYCVEAILPANAEKLAGGFGVLFLATDYNNYWVTRVLATGAVGLYKKVNNQWSTVWEVTNNGLPKTGASDLNSVRVVVKSGTITVLVNTQTVKSVRAQIPSSDLKFGFYVEYKNTSATPVNFDVRSYKVATVE